MANEVVFDVPAHKTVRFNFRSVLGTVFWSRARMIGVRSGGIQLFDIDGPELHAQDEEQQVDFSVDPQDFAYQLHLIGQCSMNGVWVAMRDVRANFDVNGGSALFDDQAGNNSFDDLQAMWTIYPV